MTGHKKNITLLVLVALMGTSYSMFYILESEPYRLLFWVSVINSALFLLLCFLIVKPDDQSKSLAFFFLLMGIVFRISLISIPPASSDDVYRYIWDGKVNASGMNPYKYAPADSALNELHSEVLPAKVNFPEIKTIYPPFSQMFFTLSYLMFGESTTGFSALLLLFELITMLFLYLLLSKLRLPLHYIGFYALCPLPILQFMVEGHGDAIGIAMLAAALYFFSDKKIFITALFLALTVLSKFIGFLFLLLLAKDLTKKEIIHLASVTIGIVIISYIPFFRDGVFPFESLFIYSEHWYFNGIFFHMLQAFIDSGILIRLISLLFLFAGLGFLIYKENDWKNRLSLGVFLLLLSSPTVYAWYIIWLAVLLPLNFRWSAAVFIAAAALTNVVYIPYLEEKIWSEPTWMLLAEYLPVLVLLFLELTGRIKIPRIAEDRTI